MQKRALRTLLILFLLSTFAAYGQQESRSFSVDFRVGTTVLDENYRDNARTLDSLAWYLDHLERNRSYYQYIDIHISGSTSLEGSHERNETIAHERQNSLNKYLLERFGIRAKTDIKAGDYINIPRIKELVNITPVSNREAIYRILDKEFNPVYYATRRDGKRLTIDNRILELTHLNGGSAWRSIEKYVQPHLRFATIHINALRKAQNLKPLAKVVIPEPKAMSKFVGGAPDGAQATGTAGTAGTVGASVADSVAINLENVEWVNEDIEEIDGFRRTWTYEEGPLTLKTNGIGWLMLIANVAVEYQFNDKISLNVPFYYSGGLNYFAKNVKFRGVVLQPEVRYHFDRVPGLYMGAHAGIGWYNFALGNNYRIQDANGKRPAVGGGLGIGFKFRFPHLPHWGMEFNLGAGVYDAVYDKFYNEPNGALVEAGIHKVFVGIDNATASITYNFGHKIRVKRGNK